MAHRHLDLASILRLQHPLQESSISVRDPKGLLCIIRSRHVGSLHFEGEEEVRGWVRIRVRVGPPLLIARHFGGGFGVGGKELLCRELSQSYHLGIRNYELT